MVELSDAGAGAVTLSTNNLITFGGDFAFGGTSNLTFGTGVITNNGNRTITLGGSGSTLAFGGAMNNTFAGNQITTVNGAGNTFVLGGYALANTITNRTDVSLVAVMLLLVVLLQMEVHLPAVSLIVEQVLSHSVEAALILVPLHFHLVH
jgi:hypothetical protein